MDAFLEFESDADAEAAVFSGAQGACCAGGDLEHVTEMSGANWLEGLGSGDSRRSGGPMPPLAFSTLQAKLRGACTQGRMP